MANYESLEQGPPEDDHERRRDSRGKSVLDERTRLADPKLLRGAPFPVVVAGFGQLLDPTGTIAASGGEEPTEDTFVHSKQVDIIHYFLSHSWRDSGKLKWLALLMQINFSSAIMAGHLLAAIAFAYVFSNSELERIFSNSYFEVFSIFSIFSFF